MSKRIPAGWRCFHCDFYSTDSAEAAEHFGQTQHCEPACSVGIQRFRAMEAELDMWRSESDPATRSFYELSAKHASELRREEERGYAAGLRDGRLVLAAFPGVEAP